MGSWKEHSFSHGQSILREKIVVSDSFKSGVKSYLVSNYVHKDISMGLPKLLLEIVPVLFSGK